MTERTRMDRHERDKLYDWLENGKVDVYLRRLMRERLAELEEGLRAAVGEDDELLQYARPERRHGGGMEALDILRRAGGDEAS